MNFSGFFKQLFKEGYLGVDIGTSSIKSVEIVRRGGSLVLKNYSHLESFSHLDRAGGAIQTSSLDAVDDEVSTLLKFMKKKMNPAVKSVVASVPNFSGFVTLIDLPKMTTKEIGQAVSFQARERIPLPIDEVLFDWSVVGETHTDDGADKQIVLLAAMPVKVVEKYQKIFDTAGLRLDAIELDSIALVRSAAGADPTPTILIDIGSRATTIIVVDGGKLQMTVNSQTAGSDLTSAIARGLRIDPRRAEQLKKTRGLVVGGADQELTMLLVPLLDGIIGEVRRTMRGYAEKYNKKIERVMLSGGSANLPHILEYFSAQLKLPTVVAAPLERLTFPQGLVPLTKELNPLLAVAIGLSIKGYQQ